MYAKWLAAGIHKPGKSAIGLAEHLSRALKLKRAMRRGTIYKMISGTREIHLNEIAPIAEYIEEAIPMLPLGQLITLNIEGVLTSNLWREEEDKPQNIGSITTPRDSEFPDAEHCAFKVDDNLMVDAGIIKGDVVICIKTTQAPSDGSLVVIRRVRAGLTMLSARRVLYYKDRVEYVVSREDDDNGYRPVVVHNKKKGEETVSVVAIIRRRTGTIT